MSSKFIFTFHKMQDKIWLWEDHTNGCKLHVKAWSYVMSDLLFCCEKEFQNGIFFIIY